MMSRSVIIIGGGIMGLGSAIELKARGFEVTLFERDQIPSPTAASTDYSKVVRMDYGSDDVYTDLGYEAINEWRKWNAWMERPLFHETGILCMTDQKMTSKSFEYTSFTNVTKRGVKLTRLNKESIGQYFPIWKDSNFVDGYYNPVGGWVESGEVVKQMSLIAIKMGVKVIQNSPIKEILVKRSLKNKVEGVVTDDGKVHYCEKVIVCAGAWSPFLVPSLKGLLLPNGQSIFFYKVEDPKRFEPKTFPVYFADIKKTGIYGFCINNHGELKIGIHGEGVPYLSQDQALEVPKQVQLYLDDWVKRNLPMLSNVPKTSRLCLYSDSWDGNFYIDHEPDTDGLMVACGGSGHAFKFAPVLGKIIADVFERKENPYAKRFRWRENTGLKQEASRPPRKVNPNDLKSLL